MSALLRRGTLTSAGALLVIILIWAGIYLPGLGSVPLKHEEPRRALPATYMLRTGDWLVPHLGASVYLRKPPVLNWLIALSFRAAGGPSDLAARLPSVLAMLALAGTVVIAARGWLGGPGALLAAIFLLTNLAAMETGRLAELEAVYLAFTGIALVLWMTAWRAGASPWWLWIAPAPCLALALLTKGPAHLLFYYGVAGCVLVLAREWKLLLHPAPGIALLLILLPFLCWAVPCAAAVGRLGHPAGPLSAWNFWWRELSSRATLPSEGHFSLGGWLWRVPQGCINFLPWTLFLPLLWAPSLCGRLAAIGPREQVLFVGARRAFVATFLLMSLLPGGSARYVYPLLVVPCLLLGRVLTLGRTDPNAGAASHGVMLDRWAAAWAVLNTLAGGVICCAAVAMPIVRLADASAGATLAGACLVAPASAIAAWWAWRAIPRVLPLALQSAAAMVAITLVYAIAAVPRLVRPRAGLPRELAASLRDHVPATRTIGVLDHGYQAFWYYLEPGVVYFQRSEEAPLGAGVDYYVLPANAVAEFTAQVAGRGQAARTIFEAADGERHRFVLLACGPMPVAPSPPGG